MRQYMSASPVAYSADGEQALVYLERHCGSLCGSGDIVWLVRGSTVTWRIQRVFNVWVS